MSESEIRRKPIIKVRGLHKYYGNTHIIKGVEAEAQMARFAYGLEPLQERIDRQPEYAHLEQMRADVKDMAARLNQSG